MAVKSESKHLIETVLPQKEMQIIYNPFRCYDARIDSYVRLTVL